MYKNIWITSKTDYEDSLVYLWDDKEGLIIIPFDENFNYAYQKSSHGQYTSLFGDKLKKIDRFKRDDTGLFESDINRELRVLSDLYLDSDEPSTGHVTLFFDIEVDSKGGFASVQKAEKEITAISNYCKQTDEYKVFLLDKEHLIQSKTIGNIEILSFDTEVELLTKWLNYYHKLNVSILTNWNGDNYDVPYLFHRLQRVFDEDTALSLSPVGIIKYNQRREKYQIAGVNHIDYLPLYKKFTYSQQPSYRLDEIGKTEVGMGKIEYEGTLDNLYRTDINKFLDYSLQDVKIIVALDNKMKFLELIRGVCHTGHIPYEDYMYPTRFIEGTILCYLHRKNIISPNKPQVSDEARQNMADDIDSFEGAYVKEPIPGLYNWIYSLDLQSLYPSTMMSLNISTETKLGKVKNWNSELFVKKSIPIYDIEINNDNIKMNDVDFRQFIEENKIVIASNGVFYKNDIVGCIPDVIDTWFKNRVDYKKKMKEALNAGNQELADYYDRRQHIQKICLNAIYGASGNCTFRFYDVDNAEAVTLTGQDIIKSTARYINTQYKLATNVEKDYIIYQDTDSCYVHIESMLLEDNKIAQSVNLAHTMEQKCNKFYDILAKKFFNCDTHRFVIRGEAIAETGLWIAKKRYILKKVYDLEKNKKSEDITIKGLDVVRSSFPRAFRSFTREILIDILNNATKEQIDVKILAFRELINTLSYVDIARNIGVKNIEKYTDKNEDALHIFKKGTPIHVKAAISYNRLLKLFNKQHINSSINNGDKIKYVYLLPNEYNLNVIGFKNYDDPPEILDFIEKYVDRDALYTNELSSKLEEFYSAMKWGKIPTEINQEMLNFFEWA